MNLNISSNTVIEACRHSDRLSNPQWLEDLIDVGIEYAKQSLEPEEWAALSTKLEEENY